MKKSFKSNAKINIGLNVLEKRLDNYHNLEMIMAPVDLYDYMEIEYFDELGTLTIEEITNTGIPINEDNIIFKIYNKFYEFTKFEKKKMILKIEKNIPFAAGLGGGSGNGASFLNEINDYYDKVLSVDELKLIGKSVGADIPFFIDNKIALVEGIGDIITPVKSSLDCKIIIVKPPYGVSTKEAYKSLSGLKTKIRCNINLIIEAISNNDIKVLENNINNNIHDALKISDVNVIKFEERLSKLFDRPFFMSGSGSAYFVLVDSVDSIKLYNEIKNKLDDCFVSINNFH